LLCGIFMLTRMRTIAQARAAVRVLSPSAS
jgi:hypothetical protein